MTNPTEKLKKIIKEVNNNDGKQLKKLSSLLLFSEFLLKEGKLSKKDFNDIKSEIKSKKSATLSKPLPHKIIENFFTKKKINIAKKSFSLTENYMFGLYLSLLLIMGILSFLGLGAYKKLSEQTEKILAYPTQPTRAGRTISFQGRLTDSLGNPITTQTDIVFKLYDAASGGNLLYTGSCTGVNGITPDQDGIINVIVGQDCGMSEIPANVFTENANIYLGVTVGTDPEMTPRQQIANVGYAINAETLQGLPPDDGSTTLPFIPYINSAGDMMLAVSAPAIRSTYQSANFEISSANIVTLTSAGTGDIVLQATESGDIKFRTQGATDTQTRVIIDNTGKVGINTLTPNYQLDVNGTVKASSTLYADGGINTTTGGLSLDSFSGTTTINDNLTVSGTTTLSSTLQLPDGTAASPALTFTNDLDTGIYRAGADSLGIITGGSAAKGITISSAGNVGIGAINPAEKLEVAGNILLPKTGTATSTAQYPSYLLKLTGSAWDTAGSTAVDKTFSLKTVGLSGSGGDSRLGVINNAGSEVFTITESGNVGIGNASPAQKLSIAGSLGILEGGTSPVYYTIFQGGDQSSDITYTLPTNIVSGGYLQTDASGNLTWTTTITANSLKWNSLTDPDGNLALNMAGNTTAFTWGAATGTSNLFTFTDSANNTGTGYLVNISTASGSALNPISISAAGTNALAVNNSGNVGIGTTSPAYKLDITGNTQIQGSRTYLTGTESTYYHIVSRGPGTNLGRVLLFRPDGADDTSGQVAITPTGTIIGGTGSSANQMLDVRGGGYFSGNVGIGTTSPGAKLQVVGGDTLLGTGTFNNPSASEDLYITGNLEVDGTIYGNVSGTINPGFTAGSVIFQGPSGLAEDNSNFFWDNTNKRLGITTNSPVNTLDLGSPTSGKGIAWANGGNANYNNIFSSYSAAGLVLASGFRGNTSSDTYISSYGGSIARVGIRLNPFGSNAGSIQFFTDPSSTVAEGSAITPTERMRIDSNGNVGIGTTSPAEKLEVAGNILLPKTGTATSTAQYPSYLLKLTGSAWDTAVSTAVDKTFSLKTIGLSGSGGDSRLGVINNAGSEVFTITESGNVGIGTTNPGSYKLYVSGSLYASNITLGGNLSTSGDIIGARFLDYTNNAFGLDPAGATLGPSGGYSLRIDQGAILAENGGNVGIGTTNPGAKLHITGGNLWIGNDGIDRWLRIFGSDGVQDEYLQIDMNLRTANAEFQTQSGSNAGFIFSPQESEAVRITATGSVGIGTTNPTQAKLVVSSGSASPLYLQTSYGYARIGALNSSWMHLYTDRPRYYFNTTITVDTGRITSYDEPLYFQAPYGSTRMTILDSNGNVGIGTTSPAEKLEVAGNILLPKTGTATSTAQYPSYLLKLTGSAWDTAGSTAVDKTFSLKTVGLSGSGGDSRLGVINNAGSEVFTITESGNVGIGTTNPGAKLHITGGNLWIGNDGIDRWLRIFGSDGVQDEYLQIDMNLRTANAEFQTQSGSNAGFIFSPQESEAVRITATGNVGIGTTNPQHKLDINLGSTNFRTYTYGSSIDVNTTGGWARSYRLVNEYNNIGVMFGGWNGSAFISAGVDTSTDSTGYLNPDLLIDTSGNVGIGTTTPGAKLEVSGTGNERIILGSGSTNWGELLFLKGGSSIWSVGQLGNVDDRFYIYNYSRASHDFVIQNNTGNVGIGTTNPGYKLDVVGDIRTTGTLFGNTRGALVNQKIFTVPAVTEKWVRIAQSPTNASINSGLFQIRWTVSGQHGQMLFYAGANFGDQNGVRLTVISADRYNNQGVDRIRILENGPYDQMYLEIYVDNNHGTNAMTVYIDQITRGMSGWDLITPVDGSIPAGYAAHEIDANTAFAVNPDSRIFTVEENGNIGIGTTFPVYNLEIQNTADAAIFLEADTDNTNETDNPFIKFSQDGGVVQAILGLVGNPGYDPENNIYTGTTQNATLLGTLSTSYDLQFGTNKTVQMTITPSGKVGIGTSAPGTKLEVNGQFRITGSGAPASGAGLEAYYSAGTAKIFAYDRDLGADLDLILGNSAYIFLDGGRSNVGIGTSTPGSSYKLDVAGTGNFTGLSVNGAAGITDANGFCGTGDLTDIETAGGLVTGAECDQGWVADLAEEYNSLEKIPPGYIVSISRDKNADPNTVEKATYKSFPIGITSTYPYRIMGKNEEINKNPVLVGLTGRVPTYVSLENGPIKKGDPLTISRDNPGVAVKALEGDIIVAYALEDYDGSFSDSEWVKRIEEELRIRALKKEAYKKLLNALEPTPADLGKIMTFISPNQYMANNLQEFALDEKGYLKNIEITPDNQIKNKRSGKIYENFSLFAQIIVGKIKSGLITSKEIITDSLNITTENITIAGQTLRDYIYQTIEEYIAQKNIAIDKSQISSPVILTEQIASKNDRIKITDASGEATLTVDTNQQKTTIKGNLTIKQNSRKNQLSKLILENYKGDQTVVIDNQGNASFSGTLQAKEIQTENLKVKNIDAENIKTKIAEIEQRLTKIVENQDSSPAQLQNPDENIPLYERINQIQSLLSEIPNTPLPDPSFYQKIKPDLKVDFALLKQLYVDQVITASNLITSQSLTVDKLFFQKNQIITLTSELNILAKERVVFFDNLVAIDNKGNLTTEGRIIAKGGIKTNVIESTDGKGISIKFQNKAEKLKIIDASFENEETVASIDASGSAYFKELSLEKYNPSTPEADLILADAAPSSPSAVLNTDSSVAGVGIIPENTQIIEIRNNKITSDALIYLTPATPDIKGQLTLAEQGKGFFKVLITEPNDKKIRFNWLIIK